MGRKSGGSSHRSSSTKVLLGKRRIPLATPTPPRLAPPTAPTSSVRARPARIPKPQPAPPEHQKFELQSWKLLPYSSDAGKVRFQKTEEALKLERLGLLRASEDEADALELTALGSFVASIDLPLEPRFALMAVCAAFLSPFCYSVKHLEEILRGISVASITESGSIPWIPLGWVKDRVRNRMKSWKESQVEEEVKIVQKERRDAWKFKSDFRTGAFLLKLYSEDPHQDQLQKIWIDHQKLDLAQEKYEVVKKRLQELRRTYPLQSVQAMLPQILLSLAPPFPTISFEEMDSAILNLLLFISHNYLAVKAYYPQIKHWNASFEKGKTSETFTKTPILVLSPGLKLLWDPPFYTPLSFHVIDEPNPFLISLHPFVSKTHTNNNYHTCTSTFPTRDIASTPWFNFFDSSNLLIDSSDRTPYLPFRSYSNRHSVDKLSDLALEQNVILTSYAAKVLEIPYEDRSEEAKEKRVIASCALVWLVNFLEDLKSETKVNGKEITSEMKVKKKLEVKVEVEVGKAVESNMEEEVASDWICPIKWKHEDWKVEAWEF